MASDRLCLTPGGIPLWHSAHWLPLDVGHFTHVRLPCWSINPAKKYEEKRKTVRYSFSFYICLFTVLWYSNVNNQGAPPPGPPPCRGPLPRASESSRIRHFVDSSATTPPQKKGRENEKVRKKKKSNKSNKRHRLASTSTLLSLEHILRLPIPPPR